MFCLSVSTPLFLVILTSSIINFILRLNDKCLSSNFFFVDTFWTWTFDGNTWKSLDETKSWVRCWQGVTHFGDEWKSGINWNNFQEVRHPSAVPLKWEIGNGTVVWILYSICFTLPLLWMRCFVCLLLGTTRGHTKVARKIRFGFVDVHIIPNIFDPWHSLCLFFVNCFNTVRIFGLETCQLLNVSKRFAINA